MYLGDPDEDGERLIYGPPPGAYGVRERARGARPTARGRGVVRAPRQTGGHRVADFNTLDDLIAHAKHELGATHVSGRDAGTRIYFPTIERGYKYEVSNVWEKGGYWHAQAPSDRTLTKHLPRDATPIDNRIHWPHVVRDYEALDNHNRVIAGPFKSYGDAKTEAERVRGVVRFVPSKGHRAPPRASEIARGQQFEVVNPDGRVISHITAPTIERAQDDLARAKNAGRYPRGSRIKGARMDEAPRPARSAHNPNVSRRPARRR